jgi:hypothetical protein
MDSEYSFIRRPGYGSKNYLIEILSSESESVILTDLLSAIKELNPKLNDIQDLWMNDEILIHIECDRGQFIFSHDIWGLTFLTADEDQALVNHISNILSQHPKYSKLEVNDSDYK